MTIMIIITKYESIALSLNEHKFREKYYTENFASTIFHKRVKRTYFQVLKHQIQSKNNDVGQIKMRKIGSILLLKFMFSVYL